MSLAGKEAHLLREVALGRDRPWPSEMQSSTYAQYVSHEGNQLLSSLSDGEVRMFFLLVAEAIDTTKEDK